MLLYQLGQAFQGISVTVSPSRVGAELGGLASDLAARGVAQPLIDSVVDCTASCCDEEVKLSISMRVEPVVPTALCSCVRRGAKGT